MFLADMPVEAMLLERPAVVHAITGSAESARGAAVAESVVVWDGSIDVGRTSYPLARRLQGTFAHGPGGFDLAMQHLNPTFVGRGRSPVSSEADLRNQIHSAFQRLSHLRPFQMDEEERTQWSRLENVIDVDVYFRETPLTVREIGKLEIRRQFASGKLRIRWHDGRLEELALNAAPNELVACPPGVWFRATNERHAVSGELQEVRDIERLAVPAELSDEAAADYWASLPSI